MSNTDPRIKTTELGGAWYQIDAPWLDEPEKVHGAKARDKRLKELSELAPDQDEGPEISTAAVVESLEPNIVQGPEDKDHNMVIEGPKEGMKRTTFDRTFTKEERKSEGMPATTRIILEENDDIPPGGLFLGVNGKSYKLMPGEKADVPNFLIEVLDNAVMSRPVMDPQTKQVLGWRDRLRYPYRRVS